MDDEEIAVVQSSEDDYELNPEEKNEKPTERRRRRKKSQFTTFDFLLILGFALIVVGMLYLKHREEAFSKDDFHIERKIRPDNHYALLGVEPGASNQEIKLKYRELSRIWHPDKNPGCNDCKERYEKIVEAYEVLTDDLARSSYDSKIGVNKALRSATETITSANFDDVVANSHTLWLLQFYDPTNELSEKAAPLWEEFYNQWKGVVRFGRVDITQNEALRSKVPFKIRSFPAILSYAPTGDFDLLSSTAAFNPTEVKRALQDLLGKAVEQISYNSATKFLETSTSYYYSRFNVLLLPKKKDIPLDYMRVAMDNFGMMNFGAVPSTERVQTLEILKVNSKHNLLYAYKPDDKKTKIESFDVNLKDMKSIEQIYSHQMGKYIFLTGEFIFITYYILE